jgi:hypothetical protein
MDTYKIDVTSYGLFEVTVTTSDGNTEVRDDFVSESAAQKWVRKHQQKKGQGPTQPPRPENQSLIVDTNEPPEGGPRALTREIQ